jgi:type VI secretion system secreted protein Hcp
MGMNAFLTIPNIKGSARQKHVEGKIVLSGVVHEVTSDIEIDVATGLLAKTVTGKTKAGTPKHKPLVVTKDIDMSSPKLHGSMSIGEKFDKVQIDFWRMPPWGGSEERHYSIILAGVTILSIKTIMQNNKRQEYALFPEQEEVAFHFDKINFVWSSGGNNGGAQQQNGKELTDSGLLDGVFEAPAEAKLKAMALDVAKDAAKALGGGIYSLIKGEPEAKGEAPK